jgi:hypothetical protein
MGLVVLLRVRNESQILPDTLAHLSSFADCICAYDDASDDDTFDLLMNCNKVNLIIRNNLWINDISGRLLAETRHRGLLLSVAKENFNFNWCMCADADERYIGDIKGFVNDLDFEDKPDGIRVSLFDAYMTEGDDNKYEDGNELLNFRKFFGPERRDILMIWKNHLDFKFVGLDSREPFLDQASLETKFYCQHYGKSLSYEHWEKKCDYYSNYFPWESYGKKWHDRKGRALHEVSDFGRGLYEWGNDLFINSIKIN